MAQQTALEWLLEQIENKNGKEFTSYYTEFIEQAKAMEKEQIRMAFTDGKLDGKFKDLKSEQYYNENYNK
jgi:hypothetical protein